MKKKREYRKVSIELCRNCSGRGYVFECDPNGKKLNGASLVPCQVCDGRGRIWKVNAGTVQIEPYEGQQE